MNRNEKNILPWFGGSLRHFKVGCKCDCITTFMYVGMCVWGISGDLSFFF